jgi:hypothetical protein
MYNYNFFSNRDVCEKKCENASHDKEFQAWHASSPLSLDFGWEPSRKTVRISTSANRRWNPHVFLKKQKKIYLS